MLLLLLLVVSAAADGPGCRDILEAGEIRPYKARWSNDGKFMRDRCLNTWGKDGIGNVFAEDCTGEKRQQWLYCGDNSVRNAQIDSFCLKPWVTGSYAMRKWAHSDQCQYYQDGSLHDHDQLIMKDQFTFVDNGGITQIAFKLVLKERPTMCLRANSCSIHDKCRMVWAWDCPGDAAEYYWYFRSRGKALGHGRLMNRVNDNMVLDVFGTHGLGHVGAAPARPARLLSGPEALDQLWTYYENGELVNGKSGQCLYIVHTIGIGARDVGTENCVDYHDQMWTVGRPIDGWFDIINKVDTSCVSFATVAGRRNKPDTVRAQTGTCAQEHDQNWQWNAAADWSKPAGKWRLLGCNGNGPFTAMMSSGITYAKEVTEDVALEVQAAISSGATFGGADVPISVLSTLATAWFNSYDSPPMNLAMACDQYGDGSTDIKTSCLWAMDLETTDAGGDTLTWSPLVVKCTPSNAPEPVCPPFMVCQDPQCQSCSRSRAGHPESRVLPPSATAGDWARPQGDWVKLACAQGPLGAMIESRTEYRGSMSGVQEGVGAAIAAGSDFMGSPMGFASASALGNMWYSTWDRSSTVTMSCDTYGDGSKWEGGCAWQFVLDTAKAGVMAGWGKLVWKPMMARCTEGMGKPQCDPMEQCADKACSKCKPAGQYAVRAYQPAAGNGFEDFDPTGWTPQAAAATFAEPVVEHLSYIDFRHETACKEVGTADDCDARGDCATRRKGSRKGGQEGPLTKCKAKKCRQIADKDACRKAKRGCISVYDRNGLYKKCKK